MDKSRIPYALLVCWLHVVAANVPPPTNVTLHCHNMQNTLQWSYEAPTSGGLKFKVFVGSKTSDPISLWVDAPAQSVDLSNFSDPDNDYMVMVSALSGSQESDAVPEDGIEFSYFRDSPVKQKCSVDLPLVNVTTLEDHLLHFSFQHPGLLYPSSPKLRRKKSTEDDLPEFHYHIEIMNQNESHKYDCIEEVCEGKLPIKASEEIYCLNITGEMRKMSVRAAKKYCSKPLKPHGMNVLAYVIPIVLVLVGGIIVALMVYIKKTRPSTSDPRSLRFAGWLGSSIQNGGAPLSPEYSFPEVSPQSPELLLPLEQGSVIFEDEIRLPLGLPSTENESEQEQGEVQESQDAGYTGGADLENDDDDEEEKTCQSPYEQRAPCPSSSEQGDSAQSTVS